MSQLKISVLIFLVLLIGYGQAQERYAEFFQDQNISAFKNSSENKFNNSQQQMPELDWLKIASDLLSRRFNKTTWGHSNEGSQRFQRIWSLHHEQKQRLFDSVQKYFDEGKMKGNHSEGHRGNDRHRHHGHHCKEQREKEGDHDVEQRGKGHHGEGNRGRDGYRHGQDYNLTQKRNYDYDHNHHQGRHGRHRGHIIGTILCISFSCLLAIAAIVCCCKKCRGVKPNPCQRRQLTNQNPVNPAQPAQSAQPVQNLQAAFIPQNQHMNIEMPQYQQLQQAQYYPVQYIAYPQFAQVQVPQAVAQQQSKPKPSCKYPPVNQEEDEDIPMGQQIIQVPRYDYPVLVVPQQQSKGQNKMNLKPRCKYPQVNQEQEDEDIPMGQQIIQGPQKGYNYPASFQ